MPAIMWQNSLTGRNAFETTVLVTFTLAIETIWSLW